MFPLHRCSGRARSVWRVPRALLRSAWAAPLLAGLLPPGIAAAQGEPPPLTIADLAAAQRALIDVEIRRTLGKAKAGVEPVVPALSPAGAAALPIPLVPASGTGGSTVAAPVRPSPAPGELSQASEPAESRLSVTGQAKLGGTWRAEVVTDAGVYLLASGQAVPGTGWHVAAVEPGRVTLSDAAARELRAGQGKRWARPRQRHFVLGDAP
jgi:hypothetical protein